MDKGWITYVGAQLRHLHDADTDEAILPKFEALVADAQKWRELDLPDSVIVQGSAAFAALKADAQRFAGLRLVLTEQDETKRNAMLTIFEQFTPESDDLTAEEVNRIFDTILPECAKVSRGES